MAARDHPVGAAAGGVEPGDDGGDGRGQLVGEGVHVGGLAEPDLGLDGEREQALALLGRGGLHARDVADRGGGDVDEVLGGVLVVDAGELAVDDGRVDDERAGFGAEDAFGAAAAGALLDEFEQAGVLERAQVVVDALAGKVHLGGQLGGRPRLAKAGEQLPPDRRERAPDLLGLVEVGGHVLMVAIDSFFCQ